MGKDNAEGKQNGFLIKTYEILQNPEYNSIVSWAPEGPGFIVHDLGALAEKVLPIYFKHSNFPSFVRQLNMYGFNKIRTSSNENHYYHKLFCRGQRNLIKEITRKVEKKMIKKQTNPDNNQSATRNNFSTLSPAVSKSSQHKHVIPETTPKKTGETLTNLATNVDVITNHLESPEHTKNRKSTALGLSTLTKLLNMNACLMEEQSFLFQDLKKEWNRMEKVVPINVQLLSLCKQNAFPSSGSLTTSETDKIMGSHQIFCERKSEAMSAIDHFLEVNQQLLARIYGETQNLNQMATESAVGENRTSLCNF